MNFLRQSTAAQSRIVGPFLDDTDFKTAETGLTIANTDVKLMKNAAASVNKNSGGGTHRVNGEYSLTFDATDTDVVGELTVSVIVAGALPVKKTFFVLEEPVYDALFGSGAIGYVPRASGIIAQGTLQSATSTTAVLAASTSFADDLILGATLVITGGTGVGQSRTVTDWVSSTDTATVDAWTTTPDATSTYDLFASPPASASNPAVVNVTKFGGTTVTGRDIGASVLLSPGTGTGQLDITSGVVKANLAQILGTALTETAGLLAAGFKKFFNVASPTGTVNSIPDAVAGNSGGLPVVGSAMTLTSGERSSIADAVWDEPIVGHLSGGTTGAALNAAGSSGDPWTTPLPGAYGSGTAGNIVGAIKTKTDLIPASPAAVSDIPTASTVAAAVWAFITEGSTTAVQAFRGITAALMGKASGLEGTTAKFRSLADDKDRITATVDESGNRTAVTRDLT